jgi:ribosomal-protein-alanine N-acetyltransferase
VSHTEPPGALQMRDLQPSDLPAVMEIERAAFTSPWQRTTFEGLLRRTDTDLLAVTAGERLVGYAVCWTILDQSELGNVAVHPDERGRGIGRLLVRAALERACGRGADECYLEVRESNWTAQTLYASCGFEAIGRRRRYYTSPVEDALVMRVRL